MNASSDLGLDTTFIEHHAGLLRQWLASHEPTRQQLAALAALAASIDKAAMVVVGVGEPKKDGEHDQPSAA